MAKQKKTICIISSFYNERENLKKFILSFDKTKDVLSKQGYNVILAMVNDGSTDTSINIVKRLKIKKKYIKIISLTKNYGQQIAIFTAIKMIDADFYGAIDSDGQQDPKFFIKMLNDLNKENLDIVQMKKKYGDYEGFTKKLFSKFFYYIFSSFTNINLQSGSSDFYLFTKKVRSEIISSNISKFFLRGFIHWTGFPKKNLEYLPSRRTSGVSKYNAYKQIDFALTAIYLYGTKLFVKLFIFSAMIMVLSLSFIIFIIYDKFFLGSQVPGWASLATIVSFFGSFNLFFCCLIAFFSTKLGNILSVKPNYILDK
jgi:glycosyltransferase involved in cell wall biosynthesis